MSAPVELEGGALGEALRMDGEVLHLVLPQAFAPGAPLRLALELEGGSITIEAKTVGSKKRADERFDVRVRPRNLRRADRDRLARLA